MNNLLRFPLALLLGGALALCGCGQQGGSKAGTDAGASGSDQVVARVNGEEITTRQLNTELATVPAAGQDPQHVRQEVLRAIIYRTILRQAAVKEKLERDPDVALLVDAARDKVLADSYINGETGSTPPPTAGEINNFIASNPLQFNERRIYQFQRLSMPTEKYSELMVPLFDQKQSFDDFEAYLSGNSIPYTINDMRLPSTDFPKQVQDELVKFGVGDNVVVRGAQSIVILKIKSWTDMPVEQNQAQQIAQNALHQKAVQQRVQSVRDELTQKGKVEFLGDFAGMSLAEPETASNPAGAPANSPPRSTPSNAPPMGSGNTGANRQETTP